MTEIDETTAPEDITAAVAASFDGCSDPRLVEVVTAPGFETVVTHLFDSESAYLGSDAVFGVKPSLVRRFVPRSADDLARPAGVEGAWYSLESDFILVPSAS
jgi:hypothetical protein